MVDVGLLKYVVQFVFVVALLLFVHSGAFGWVIEHFLQIATANLPEPKNRRERKKIHNALPFSTQKKAFWWLVGLLSTIALIDLFVFPNTFRLELDWLIPSVVAAFETGFLVIFVGPINWFGRNNWSKWTFWTSVITTAGLFLWICRIFHFSRPRGIFGLLFLSFLQFLWLFGMLGRIDRNEAELHQLNSSESEHT